MLVSRVGAGSGDRAVLRGQREAYMGIDPLNVQYWKTVTAAGLLLLFR